MDRFESLLHVAIHQGDIDDTRDRLVEPEYGSIAYAQECREDLIRFNRTVDQLVHEHGLDKIGKAVWYLYGCLGDLTRDALDPRIESGVKEFYDSLRDLYNLGFAQFCDDTAGHSARGGHFATACYMLWDMDSGLEYLTFKPRSDLFDYGEQLVDFGLNHKHAAVQESFLHCLGHREMDHTQFVRMKINRFLRRRDISPGIRKYAKQCKVGAIQ